MKKVIIILLLMFFDIHGFLIISHAENANMNSIQNDSVVEKTIMAEVKNYDSNVDSTLTIKQLTERLALTEVMGNLHENIVIHKWKLSYYKSKIAMYETGRSKKPYQLTNKFGFMGKYQFGKPALRTLNKANLITYETPEKFLNDSSAQEKAMDALIVYNMDFLRDKKMYRYLGTKINDITITAEGMLAGAHLVGPAAVLDYVKTGGSLDDFVVRGRTYRKFDGNGVSVENYLKMFSKI